MKRSFTDAPEPVEQIEEEGSYSSYLFFLRWFVIFQSLFTGICL
jgi:hypothetical protein